MSFDEADAKRVLKKHFEKNNIKNVQIVGKYSGISERSKIYIGFLNDDKDNVVKVCIVKIDENERLNEEKNNCDNIKGSCPTSQYLVLDNTFFITDTQTQQPLLIFDAVQKKSGDWLSNPQKFGDFAKKYISNNPTLVWDNLYNALKSLNRTLYNRFDDKEGKKFNEIEPYVTIFSKKIDEIRNEFKKLPDDLKLKFKKLPDDFNIFNFNESLDKILNGYPEPNYMRCSSWIHGDLNPTNILISDGMPYIIDFASSKTNSHLAFDFISIETQLIISLLENVPVKKCYDFCQRLFALTPDYLQKKNKSVKDTLKFLNHFLPEHYLIRRHLFKILANLRAYAYDLLKKSGHSDYAFKDYHGALSLYAFAFIRHSKIINKNYPNNGLALCLIISQLAFDAFIGVKHKPNPLLRLWKWICERLKKGVECICKYPGRILLTPLILLIVCLVSMATIPSPLFSSIRYEFHQKGDSYDLTVEIEHICPLWYWFKFWSNPSCEVGSEKFPISKQSVKKTFSVQKTDIKYGIPIIIKRDGTLIANKLIEWQKHEDKVINNSNKFRSIRIIAVLLIMGSVFLVGLFLCIKYKQKKEEVV